VLDGAVQNLTDNPIMRKPTWNPDRAAIVFQVNNPVPEGPVYTMEYSILQYFNTLALLHHVIGRAHHL
jgi:hypothetical protein